MSNFLRKITRKDKKDYKKLYEIELQNRKAYEARYKEMHEQYVELQKGSGIAELRKENMQLKHEITELKIELDDTKCFLQHEKEVSEALRKEVKDGSKNDKGRKSKRA